MSVIESERREWGRAESDAKRERGRERTRESELERERKGEMETNAGNENRENIIFVKSQALDPWIFSIFSLKPLFPLSVAKGKHLM